MIEARYAIKSMTGFGQGTAEADGLRVEVEIKGVNHRFLDIKMRLPPEHARVEPALRARVQASVARGRIDVVAVLTSTRPAAHRVEVDRALIAEYLRAVNSVAREFRLRRSPRTEFLLTLPGAMAVRTETATPNGIVVTLLEEALDQALEAFENLRRLEGKRLALDLMRRLAVIQEEVMRIEARAAGLTESHASRLRERLEALLSDHKRVDAIRLEQEVALMATRVDISEELIRLKGYLAQAGTELDRPRGPVGKVVDFLMQEMNREANTISSKAEDLSVCRSALLMKSELEKIREQVQNLE